MTDRPVPETAAADGAGEAYRWSVVSLGARVVLQALSGIVIARELGPAAFGIGMLVVSVYTVVASVVMQGGNGPLLVRSRVEPQYLRRTVSADLGLGALAAAGFLAAAALWTGGPQAGRLGLVLAAAGCLVQSVAGPAVALNARHLRFGRIARGEVLGALLGAATGIGVAVATGSAAALPLQAVVVDVVILAAVAPALVGRPRDLPRTDGPEPGARYAVHLSATQLASIGSRNVDNYVVAALLGSASLGVYLLAYRLMMLPIQNVAMVLTRVLVPTLRHLAAESARATTEVRRVLLAVALVTGPATGAAVPLVDRLVPGVFGAEWEAAAVLASAGRSREQLALTTGSLVAAAVAALVGSPWGVTGVTTAFAVLSLLTATTAVLVTRATTGLPVAVPLSALGYHLLAGGAAAAVAAAAGVVLGGLGGAVAALLLGAVVGLLAGRSLRPAAWADASGFWRSVVRRGSPAT